MITLSLIKNATQASKYYAADNYYLSELNAKEVSEWWGKGAEGLGLNGRVEEQDLEKVLEGMLPNGVTIGLQKNGKQNHRPGYDICFHAPKSVSILALEAKDQRFYDAHLSAVKETLALIERDCAQAKVYQDEKISFQNTKNLSVALVKHITSRDLDPQLHHHALIMNATKRKDGTWRALASSLVNDGETNGFFERVHKNQIYYGLIYKSSLANKIIQLGCEIETVGPHGLWEIKGVPKEAREALSKRRQQIEEQLSKLHYKSLKAADVAALDTRKKKLKELNLNDLREAWKNELANVGFSSQEFIAKLSGKILSDKLHETAVSLANDKQHEIKKEGNTVDANAKEAIENAIAHLSQYHLKLDYSKVLSQALELSIGKITHKDVITAFNEQVKAGALIPIDKDGSLFVTKELLDVEKNIVDYVVRGKETDTSTNLNANALNKLEDNEIKDSLVKTLQTNGRVVLVESRLTNNAEFISGILNLSEASGKNVRILSPNRATALDINENIRRKPNTIWQWLLSLGKPELGESVAGFKYRYASELEHPSLNVRQGKDIILVHDAETVGVRDVEKILELTERSKAKVILLQNHGLRPNLSAGNSMVTLKQAGIDTIYLRQKEAPKTIDLKLVVVKENEERVKSLADLYAGKGDRERAETTILVGSKEQVKPTNQAIRYELKLHNKLSSTEVAIKTLVPIYMSGAESGIAHRYQNNMVVRFYNEGAPAEDWKIESINKEKNLIRLVQNGKRVLWNPQDDIARCALFKEEGLQIAKGDRLVALANMNSLEVKNGTKFIVSDIGNTHVKLTTNKKTLKISLKDLHNSHLSYNYATTFSKHVKKESSHILADVKAYFLDKSTYNELTRHAKDTLTIFTNDQELAEKRLGSNCPRLTAAETVLDTAKNSGGNSELDRLISDRTTHELKQDIEKTILVLKEQYFKNDSKSIESKAVEFAIGKITSHNAGFTHKELVAEALTYALQNGLKAGVLITHEDIMKAIEEKRSSGELVMGRHFSDGTRWTTKELLDLEHSIIDKIKDRKDKLSPLLDSKATASLLDKISSKNNLNLTLDQKNACNLITTTKDQFIMIQGYAGTGKTTLFRFVKDILNEKAEISKYESVTKSEGNIAANSHLEAITILALAPTHRAVKELKALDIKAQTLKRFLVEQKKEIKKDGSTNKFDRTMFILDEASMVSNKDFDDFLNIIDGTNCRVVLSGDIAQHLSIESGKPFELIQKLNIIATAYLKEIIRQKNPNLKDAVINVISGHYKEAFNKIANENPRANIERTKESSFLATLKSSIIEVDNNKLKPGDKTLESLVAEDFLTRTKEIRDNTVVIVHANKDRKTINEHIREGLKKEGVIAKNGLKLDCLISKNLTDAEHRVLSSYKPGDVIKLAKKYYHVAEIDYDSKSLLLKDEKNNSKLFCPEKYAQKYNYGVYEKTKAELAVGDNIRLTKTDKERSLYANFKYEVTDLNKNKATLRKLGTTSIDSNQADPQTITLNPKELSDAHWDYAYTVTGYGIQGGSKLYAIDFEVSHHKNLANQRSFYIGISRAIKHLVIYTDNKARLLKRILSNKGDKYSSIEVAEGNCSDIKRKANDTGLATKNAAGDSGKSHNMNPGKQNYDSKIITKLINNQAEAFIERLFGQPNQKLSSPSKWRYGNKGSLVISMSGDKRGLWHNFETGESGNLITLIQKEMGLGFKDVLQYVSQIFDKNMLIDPVNETRNNHKKQAYKSRINEMNNINATKNYAKKLYEESIPIAGTIVERYLKEIRGINTLDCKDIRYHPSVYIGKDSKRGERYYPAMLAIGRDKDNNVQCVQATYLDNKTANKANLDIKKRTYSSLSGSSVLLNSAENNKHTSENKNRLTYIAEGIETGLSIKDALKNSDVFVTLGKSNFVNIDTDKMGNKIVFCLDNDGKNLFNDAIIHKAAERLISFGKEVFFTVPGSINNNKTDFNDVLKAKGVGEVKTQLGNLISYEQFKHNHQLINSREQTITKYLSRNNSEYSSGINLNANKEMNNIHTNIRENIQHQQSSITLNPQGKTLEKQKELEI